MQRQLLIPSAGVTLREQDVAGIQDVWNVASWQRPKAIYNTVSWIWEEK